MDTLADDQVCRFQLQNQALQIRFFDVTDVLPGHRMFATWRCRYLSVISIVLNDSSVLAQRLVRNSLNDISKVSTISSKLIRKKKHVRPDKENSERKATLPEAAINRQRSTGLLDPEKILELQIPPSQLGPDGDPKRTKILNYEEMKQIALSIAHEPLSRLLLGTDKRISGAQKFAEEIGHANRGDCSFGHAHLGILAIPFLLKDTLTDEGCKW
jgi:hypothetical protein